jgi:hypothetical protein
VENQIGQQIPEFNEFFAILWQDKIVVVGKSTVCEIEQLNLQAQISGKLLPIGPFDYS